MGAVCALGARLCGGRVAITTTLTFVREFASGAGAGERGASHDLFSFGRSSAVTFLKFALVYAGPALPLAREITNQIAFTDTQCQEHVLTAFTFRAQPAL